MIGDFGILRIFDILLLLVAVFIFFVIELLFFFFVDLEFLFFFDILFSGVGMRLDIGVDLDIGEFGLEFVKKISIILVYWDGFLVNIYIILINNWLND